MVGAMLRRAFNANLLRRWVIEAERAERATSGRAEGITAARRELRSGADAAGADARGCDPCGGTPRITDRERAVAELGDARVRSSGCVKLLK